MEYEKVRFDRLNQVVKKAVEHTIKKLLMPEQVYKCFPTISRSDTGPDALENARKQMQTYFHDTCVKQVKHIFTERDIEQKLNELDEIIQLAQQAREGNTRKQIEVDRLAPEELINAGLAELKPDSEKKLALIYDQLVLDNQRLQQELREFAEESHELADGVVLLVAELLGEVDEMMRLTLNENLKLLSAQFFDAYV
ncbi:Nnf1-domain-containing protein [Metschnikowia bicuspidata var. bicuspidata NRRL YB-4993]|uniref:Kinetochore-associated protein n=1 Tax=Metschnikowia bicuspidata var. bicuspidata NRRL YB-4993 TaxID=869754 RepID=A0A1A0HJQ2_9ASCO|nr:Nnf1-domain-containing protein [Metschnikowia bicuspidata var. bicuspidata NRRL YB-4993]OBA24399.1 Nnf1-domain-containing protein [Metschnikowia bicuspidata var. bicuspidata NRRL YB-4993]